VKYVCRQKYELYREHIKEEKRKEEEHMPKGLIKKEVIELAFTVVSESHTYK